MHRILLIMAGLSVFLIACSAAPSPSPSPLSARIQVPDGQFTLSLELPKTAWNAGEPITGKATLQLVGPASAAVTGSGSGLIGFEYLEVGGRWHVEPAWTADCGPYRLDASQPTSSALTKSGGFTGEDPDAAFYRAFFTDPLVHLPAGLWQITAVSSFTEGGDCTGPAHLIRAPITIEVGA